ncbi:MAG: hypothetical protein ACOWYE_18575 [Desulfatiglandales bacterium]
MKFSIFRGCCRHPLLPILPLAFFLLSCLPRTQPTLYVGTTLHDIRKIVVIGFQPALAPGQASGVTRGPVTGSVFMADPTTWVTSEGMTDRLFDNLNKIDAYDLITPGRARGAFSGLIGGDAVLGEVELAQRIGQAFAADAVLMGYIYRWRERQGTDYAVNSPASVAFDLYLIGPEEGRILWKGQFDKTQHSLSENLFDMSTFFRGKGKWMKVGELAEFGLESVLSSLYKATGVQEDEP